jgi:hypothetical protein
MPEVRIPKPLTDNHRAALVALQALVVAIQLGEFKSGENPLHALYRGIEKAHEHSDRVTCFRYGFARRLDHARCIALNGSDSVAVPLDWFERSRAFLEHPAAEEAMPVLLNLYFEHPDFTAADSDTNRMTVISNNGVERYLRPDRVGAEMPPSGWRGQGIIFNCAA